MTTYVSPFADGVWITPPNGEYGNFAPFRNNPHYGQDAVCALRTKLRAVVGGRVYGVGYSTFLGYSIVWIGDDGYFWSFSHLYSKPSVRGRIEAGDVIAESGASGQVTGPHLHVAVGTSPTIGVNTHDPMKHLASTRPASSAVTPITEREPAMTHRLLKVAGNPATFVKFNGLVLETIGSAEATRYNLTTSSPAALRKGVLESEKAWIARRDAILADWRHEAQASLKAIADAVHAPRP